MLYINYIALAIDRYWALAIDPFLSPPADGRSLITLSQPHGASERSERTLLRLRQCDKRRAQQGINSKGPRWDQ